MLDLTEVVDELFTELAIKASDEKIGFRSDNGLVDFASNEYTPGLPVTTWVDGFIPSSISDLLDGTRFDQADIAVGTSYKYEPQKSDRLIVDGKEYSIIDISPVKDSGIVHYYNVIGQI
ncbi:MAG: hypothetical protein KAI26_09490 [Nanoarchaeota archaeon]|nr:hypothetical protein [Nanoarchaeota archaeon]